MNNRQQIINELKILISDNNIFIPRIADFIIQDRKRTIQEYKTIFFCDCDKDI